MVKNISIYANFFKINLHDDLKKWVIVVPAVHSNIARAQTRSLSYVIDSIVKIGPCRVKVIFTDSGEILFLIVIAGERKIFSKSNLGYEYLHSLYRKNLNEK